MKEGLLTLAHVAEDHLFLAPVGGAGGDVAIAFEELLYL